MKPNNVVDLDLYRTKKQMEETKAWLRTQGVKSMSWPTEFFGVADDDPNVTKPCDDE